MNFDTMSSDVIGRSIKLGLLQICVNDEKVKKRKSKKSCAKMQSLFYCDSIKISPNVKVVVFGEQGVQGGPKVSHYEESLNRIKNCQCGYISISSEYKIGTRML